MGRSLTESVGLLFSCRRLVAAALCAQGPLGGGGCSCG